MADLESECSCSERASACGDRKLLFVGRRREAVVVAVGVRVQSARLGSAQLRSSAQLDSDQLGSADLLAHANAQNERETTTTTKTWASTCTPASQSVSRAKEAFRLHCCESIPFHSVSTLRARVKLIPSLARFRGSDVIHFCQERPSELSCYRANFVLAC